MNGASGSGGVSGSLGDADRERRMHEPVRYATFVVRVSWDDAGTVAGVVELVRTGAKIPFRDAEGPGRILGRMIAAEIDARERPADGMTRT